MKKQYLAVLFISIFAFYSGAEGKKDAQGNLTITNLTSSSSSQTAEGGSRSLSSLAHSTHFGAIPFSIEAFDNDGIKEVKLRFRQNGSTVGRLVICDNDSSSKCTGKRINKNIMVDPANYGADNGLLEVDLMLVNASNQQSKLATVKVLHGVSAPYGTFISPRAYSIHFSAISFSIAAFDNDGIKELKLRFRQNGSTLANPVICNDDSSNTCEGTIIRENVSFNPVDYGAVNGGLEVDLVLVNEQNQQSELATVSISNWEMLAPYGSFISPHVNSRHSSAILFSIEAFDDDDIKQIGLTFKQNGDPFINLLLCDDVTSVCTGNRMNKEVTVDIAEYGIDNGIITIDLWSIDGRDLNNELATLNLQWEQLEVSQGRLNDTGMTWGGSYPSGDNTTCTSNIDASQDCDYGRDAQAAAGKLTKRGAGAAGFDFTKLDASGNTLTKQDGTWNDDGNASDGTKWSCVRDNHTGLIWEVKTNDGGIHDAVKRYRWGGKTAIGKRHEDAKGPYYGDWDELVDGANSERLCGFNDWRVPDIEELRSIVDYSRVNPAIDTSYFPNIDNTSWKDSSYWSSSPYAHRSDHSWGLYFYYGYDYYDYNRSWSLRVRLVRFGQ